MRRGITYGISVATDPYLNSMTVKWQGTNFHSLGYGWIDHYIAGPGPAIVWSTSILANPSAPQVVVHNEPVPVPNMSICTNLEAKLGRAPTLTSRPVDHGGTVSQAAR